jgi:hypothetical protein
VVVARIIEPPTFVGAGVGTAVGPVIDAEVVGLDLPSSPPHAPRSGKTAMVQIAAITKVNRLVMLDGA